MRPGHNVFKRRAQPQAGGAEGDRTPDLLNAIQIVLHSAG